MDNKNLKIVYTITERGEKSFWHRIGIGYVNRDGSINIKLDAVPVNGTMHVRDWSARDDMPAHDTRKGSNGSSRNASSHAMDSLPGGF
jgi:hypothetical protein